MVKPSAGAEVPWIDSEVTFVKEWVTRTETVNRCSAAPGVCPQR